MLYHFYGHLIETASKALLLSSCTKYTAFPQLYILDTVFNYCFGRWNSFPTVICNDKKTNYLLLYLL